MTQPPEPTGPGPASASAEASTEAVAVHSTSGHTGGGLAGGLIRLARPKQWLKNVLVFVSARRRPVSSSSRSPWCRRSLAFVVFCLVASGTYFINDARDVEADRQHVKKRFRPMAAGSVPVRLGLRVRDRAAGGGAGTLLRRQLAARPGDRRLPRPHHVVLAVAQARTGDRPGRSGRGVRAARAGRCGRHGHPDLELVPHRRLARLAVHGGGQAGGRTPQRRARRA